MKTKVINKVERKICIDLTVPLCDDCHKIITKSGSGKVYSTAQGPWAAEVLISEAKPPEEKVYCAADGCTTDAQRNRLVRVVSTHTVESEVPC